MADITVYGTDQCEDTQRTRQFLSGRGIAYRYVDVDQDRDADEMVKRENDGKRRTPLVQVCIGTECRVLRVPSNQELEDAVRDLKAVDAA
jgi:mycoredoxin